jgi:hypothetical protein
MSPTTLSLQPGIIKIIPGQGEYGRRHPGCGWGRENHYLFYSEHFREISDVNENFRRNTDFCESFQRNKLF